MRRPQDNALQLTRGASEASGLRRTHPCLVPLAAERECYAGYWGRPFSAARLWRCDHHRLDYELPFRLQRGVCCEKD
jgi:hypothetical protein